MRVLGLDPSLTNFGYALVDSQSGECIERGRIRTSPDEFADFVDRYLFIKNELSALIQRLHPDKIGLEHSVFGSSQSEAMYALYVMTMETVKLNLMDVVQVSPSQLKSWARTFIKRPSNWKMEKTDMIEAAMVLAKDKGKKWHDGEADAYLLGKFASIWWEYKEGNLSIELSEVERHAICGLHVLSKGKKAGKTSYKGIEHSEGEKFFLWSKIQKEKIGGKIQKERRTSSRKVKSS